MREPRNNLTYDLRGDSIVVGPSTVIVTRQSVPEERTLELMIKIPIFGFFNGSLRPRPVEDHISRVKRGINSPPEIAIKKEKRKEKNLFWMSSPSSPVNEL